MTRKEKDGSYMLTTTVSIYPIWECLHGCTRLHTSLTLLSFIITITILFLFCLLISSQYHYLPPPFFLSVSWTFVICFSLPLSPLMMNDTVSAWGYVQRGRGHSLGWLCVYMCVLWAGVCAVCFFYCFHGFKPPTLLFLRLERSTSAQPSHAVEGTSEHSTVSFKNKRQCRIVLLFSS